uniref:SfsA N-terminal OB domain-containing protein n=1 Tax=Chromera velia CCMP2878 TaxID=1169474 RepID=A0A0G4HBT7_9ALVE|eukprot:Cvel_25910.t1-p1 / transcript=Cvel_25910.t1 / gene=Cvel_25910 / organism=Chromera_velia_CCMP2878 / gene_product=Sugar fermentation stimulation protein homolog, putative / transcript_product=Sugar fermentation stimulation protein homolog, putative / location=Cvel_scaffold2994:11995-16579(-) / protein_length=874 / sequence_SO=supercontig / SO=protein_coding / is_pseudo=false
MSDSGFIVHRYPPLVRGKLVRRYKRFLADVQLEDGNEVTVHVANPGSMLGILPKGADVRLSKAPEGSNRKLRYSLEAIKVRSTWVAVNTQLSNLLVRNLLREHQPDSGQDGEVDNANRKKKKNKAFNSFDADGEGDASDGTETQREKEGCGGGVLRELLGGPGAFDEALPEAVCASAKETTRFDFLLVKWSDRDIEGEEGQSASPERKKGKGGEAEKKEADPKVQALDAFCFEGANSAALTEGDAAKEKEAKVRGEVVKAKGEGEKTKARHLKRKRSLQKGQVDRRCFLEVKQVSTASDWLEVETGLPCAQDPDRKALPVPPLSVTLSSLLKPEEAEEVEETEEGDLGAEKEKSGGRGRRGGKGKKRTAEVEEGLNSVSKKEVQKATRKKQKTKREAVVEGETSATESVSKKGKADGKGRAKRSAVARKSEKVVSSPQSKKDEVQVKAQKGGRRKGQREETAKERRRAGAVGKCDVEIDNTKGGGCEKAEGGREAQLEKETDETVKGKQKGDANESEAPGSSSRFFPCPSAEEEREETRQNREALGRGASGKGKGGGKKVSKRDLGGHTNCTATADVSTTLPASASSASSLSRQQSVERGEGGTTAESGEREPGVPNLCSETQQKKLNGKVALWPDSATERGRKHIRGLMDIVRPDVVPKSDRAFEWLLHDLQSASSENGGTPTEEKGKKRGNELPASVLVFCVVRGDCTLFDGAPECDAEYFQLLHLFASLDRIPPLNPTCPLPTGQSVSLSSSSSSSAAAAACASSPLLEEEGGRRAQRRKRRMTGTTQEGGAVTGVLAEGAVGPSGETVVTEGEGEDGFEGNSVRSLPSSVSALKRFKSSLLVILSFLIDVEDPDNGVVRLQGVLPLQKQT